MGGTYFLISLDLLTDRLFACSYLGILSALLCALIGTQHHGHVPTVKLWELVDLSDRFYFLCDSFENFAAKFRMEDLSASEHDRDLHLVAVREKFFYFAGFGVEITLSDFRPVFHLLEGNRTGLFP